jgi:hypothetical protein
MEFRHGIRANGAENLLETGNCGAVENHSPVRGSLISENPLNSRFWVSSHPLHQKLRGLRRGREQ